MDIPCIYLVDIHGIYIYTWYTSIQGYTIMISSLTRMDIIYGISKGYTMYIPCIYRTSTYTWYIPGIFQAYTENKGSRWWCTHTHKYVLFTPSTYLVRTIFSHCSTHMVHTSIYSVYKNIAGEAVLCRMPAGRETILCAAVTCSSMRWCSNTELSARPIGVQHWHVWHYYGTYSVRTCMYRSVLLYLSCQCQCTGLYLAWVRTCTTHRASVRTCTYYIPCSCSADHDSRWLC